MRSKILSSLLYVERKGKIIKAFSEDIKKYYLIEFGTTHPPSRKKLRLWLFNWGLHCVAIYRMGEYITGISKKNWILTLFPLLLYQVLSIIISLIHHVEIQAEIGPGFYIGHASNIYIGPSKIGSNFSITHNVTIGLGQGNRREGIPMIGNNVWVGTGSVLFGGIVIGDKVTVMAGTTLSKNIPSGCLVGGNPARVVKQNYDNRSLFNGYYYETSTGSDKKSI